MQLSAAALSDSSYVATTLSTPSSSAMAADETVLHKTFIQNANFYNEDEEPETLRVVLESILRPYGAFIIQDRGVLIVTDVHAIATDSVTTAKNYTTTDFSYSGSSTFSTNLGDITSLGFSGTDQKLNVLPGVNKQVVKYSPYRKTKVLDYRPEEDFQIVTTVTSHGTAPYRYSTWMHDTSKSWEASDAGKFVKLLGIDDTTAVDNYLLIDRDFTLLNITTTQFIYTPETSYISPAAYSIRLSVQAYAQVSNDLDNPADTPDSISQILLCCEFAIGDKKYCDNSNGTRGWYPVTDSTKALLLKFEEMTTGNKETGQAILQAIDDRWVDSGRFNYKDNKMQKQDYLIPLDSGYVNGNFTFKICGYVCYDLNGQLTTAASGLRIKNIEMVIVDAIGNEVKEVDIEYVGYMDPKYKGEGDPIELIQGSNLTDFPVERGGLMKLVDGLYSYVHQWTRAGVTDNIENLLLRSFVGNYNGKTLSFSCSLNLLNRIVGFLSYGSQLAGYKFMITAANIDFENRVAEVTLQAVYEDALTIYKSW